MLRRTKDALESETPAQVRAGVRTEIVRMTFLYAAPGSHVKGKKPIAQNCLRGGTAAPANPLFGLRFPALSRRHGNPYHRPADRLRPAFITLQGMCMRLQALF